MTLLISIALSVLCYSLGSAIVRRTSDTRSWSSSVFKTFAVSRINREFSDASDAEVAKREASGSFWGPRTETERTDPDNKDLLGVFTDVWGIGRILQFISPMIVLFAALMPSYGWQSSLLICAGVHVVLTFCTIMLSKFGLSSVHGSIARTIAVVSVVAVLVFGVIQVSQLNMIRTEIEDSRLQRYMEISDSLNSINHQLESQIDSLSTREDSIRVYIDSILLVKSDTEHEYSTAIDFLERFIKNTSNE